MSKTFIESLEALGEEAVRAKRANGGYGAQGLTRQLVDDWLDMKAHSRESLRDSRSKIMETIAAIAAIVAAVAAIIGAIASMVPLFR